MNRMLGLAVMLGVAASLLIATVVATSPSVEVSPGTRLVAQCVTGFTTPTITSQSIEADCLPHATATAAATATATTPVQLTGWHAPTNHEHGDAPPAWAETWSQAQFGHGIVFGGDEATPGEDHHKHQAYKGYAFTKGAVSVYVRVHEASNAMDRGVRWHSYEVYARDATGAVSFWQGWMDRGDPATQRFTTCGINCDVGHPLRGTPHGWVSVGFVNAIVPGGLTEMWYTRGPDWGWDIVTMIYDGTSAYKPGETVSDPESGWQLTGKLGVRRSIAAYYYADGSARYPTRNTNPLRGWFCATPEGVITGPTSGPSGCAAGSLAQYVAPTMPTAEAAMTSYHTYTAAGVALPN